MPCRNEHRRAQKQLLRLLRAATVNGTADLYSVIITRLDSGDEAIDA